jgi:hypothetical protein
MSPVKKLHFFATDLGEYPFARRWEEYTALFQESTDRHLAIGEASA